MIAAMAKDNAIGKNNDIPWLGKLPADMAHFIEKTRGKPVIMGRKTFDSIGKALPNRKNIVVSSNTNLSIENVLIVSSIEAAIALVSDSEEIMVIGGTRVYNECISIANKLYITDIDCTISDADAFFPEIKSDEWLLKKEKQHKKDELNKYNYKYREYERK